eukprot:CAMPEP_0178987160 /NCGR_PEP_ID=MMETSP0795-20121207/3109_1 /TAXON_ID=88552 /ORGANISM="Amoebophrya sp., Strain Ameob2" /LENGTH=67 /DNA_ID=CAMNT_0020678309 /DNA_START=131 /DNA_END=334 /DNA_ORIENTATION=+
MGAKSGGLCGGGAASMAASCLPADDALTRTIGGAGLGPSVETATAARLQQSVRSLGDGQQSTHAVPP